LEFVLRTL